MTITATQSFTAALNAFSAGGDLVTQSITPVATFAAWWTWLLIMPTIFALVVLVVAMINFMVNV